MASSSPDSTTTGLTLQERQAVRDVWRNAVKEDLPALADVVFELFFTRHLEYLQLFQVFKGIPLDQMNHKNKVVVAHARNVFYSLAALLDSLVEDEECMFTMLQKQGINHHGKKVNEKMFADLGVAIIDTLKQFLGPQTVDNFTVTSWNKAWVYIVNGAHQGMMKARNNE